MSRLKPRVLLAFVLLLTAFAIGLTNMERIFLRERSDASSRLESHRRAIQGFAVSAIRDVLHHRWEEARPAELTHLPESESAGLRGPALHDGWYIEPGSDGRWVGVKVDFQGLLESATSNLQARKLLDEGDWLDTNTTAAVIPIDGLALTIISPGWEKEEVGNERRFWLKTGLVVAFGLLVICLAALASLEQLRRQRYIELKSDFISTVSHELRTPLAAIRVLAETLEERFAGAPAARDYPTRIVGEVDRLSGLVENILSFNRLDKGRWAPRFADVELLDLMAVVHAEATVSANGPVEIKQSGMELKLRADPELLKLLFANLTRNACRYNTRSPVQLTIDAERRDGVRIRFKDNGIGIPEAEQGHIFEEFYRADGPGRPPGTGLGLALCRQIVLLHKGTIRVAESGPAGTTFELELG